MKYLLTTCLLMTACLAYAQQATITSVSDSRLPQEVREKLSAITTPEALQNFNYSSTVREVAKDTAAIPGATIETKRNFHFSNGQIIGEITITKSFIGFSSQTETTSVELCYQFCCTDQTGVEHCTPDYNIYKQWMKHPENCVKTKTTVCN